MSRAGQRAASQNVPPQQGVDHFARQALGIFAAGHQVQFGIFRRLIGLIDAGKILDLAGERAAVQALRVACDALLERGKRSRN